MTIGEIRLSYELVRLNQTKNEVNMKSLNQLTGTKEDRDQSIKSGLRVERARAGVSQATLCSVIGVNPSTYSGWESRDGSVGLEEAWRIAEVYGISLDQLAGRA